MISLQSVLDAFQGKAPIVAKRSGQWPAVRQAHLAVHPTCAVCGGTRFLRVHHIQEFHKYPELELDTGNLITLCEHPVYNDHLRYGHLGNYKSINEHVRWDADIWRNKIENRP